MTTTIILTAIAAFVWGGLIGFLLGERRAVKQCNAILDARLRDLLKVVLEEEPLPTPAEREEPKSATIH